MPSWYTKKSTRWGADRTLNDDEPKQDTTSPKITEAQDAESDLGFRI